MADFPPGLWLLLIGAVLTGVIGCGCVLATALRQQTDLHDLKVRVLNLRISYLAFMKALNESEDPDALCDDPDILAGYLRGEIPYAQARAVPDEPTPAPNQSQAQKSNPKAAPATPPATSPKKAETAGKIEPNTAPSVEASASEPEPALAAA